MKDREQHYIPVEGKLIEVEKAVYDAYYQMDRRERYIEERDEENGVVSYQTIEEENIDGESGLLDPNAVTIEEQLIAKEIMNRLYRCIALLPRAERELIIAVYFEGLSTKDYAMKEGLSKRTVDERRSRILRKMREILYRMDK